MSRRRMFSALLGITALTALAVSCSDDDSAGTPSLAPTSAATGPATVTVAIRDLAGADGKFLAGVLYAGTADYLHPQGGFGAAVDADPYSSDHLIRVGTDYPPPGPSCNVTPRPVDCLRFPYVTDQASTVVPGDYTLQLWLSPVEMGPYDRWLPADQVGLAGCSTTFRVDAPNTTVTVTAIPGTDDREYPCTLG